LSTLSGKERGQNIHGSQEVFLHRFQIFVEKVKNNCNKIFLQ